jgi:hypothetical protein
MPDGWTRERLHRRAPEAVVLDPARHYAVAENALSGLRALTPDSIIRFGRGPYLCLVRDSVTGDWYMGNLDESDASIVCWASYGPDLDGAIDAL